MKLRNVLLYTGLFIVLFIIGFKAADLFSRNTTVKRTRFLLGTIVEIQVRDLDEQSAEKVIGKAFDEFSRIDDLLSIYKTTSPLLKINKSIDSVLTVDPEIYSLIKECQKLTAITHGAFDISIDTLISLWGFGKDKMSVPDKRMIQSAFLSSGIQNLRLSENNTVIRRNNLKFNFGAIAAGYAVDRVTELLKRNNVQNALINGGGEIRSIGENWSVGIQHPRVQGAMIDKIRLNGFSVATSGDYEQCFEENGIRYHHILNPFTGRPARGCQSVTIISRTNTMADALATGVFVLGPEKGMALVESLKDVEALIVDKNGTVSRSSGFHQFLLR